MNDWKKYYPHIVFILFSLLLYGNTLSFDYTLDDFIVIKQNAFTTKGFTGIPDIFGYDSFTGFFGKEKKLVEGGRYRPLSIATFAVEYQFFGKLNPFFSHLVNILIYAFTASLLFIIFRRLLPVKPKFPWFFSGSFAIALIFLAHPVHSEVVANIKGRDELLALLLSLVAVWISIRYSEILRPWLLVAIAFSLFLALLSKENAMAFVIIIPAIIFLFFKEKLRALLHITIALFMAGIAFVLLRYNILGYLSSGELPSELLNNPFLGASVSQKFGTILLTLGEYLRLLLYPATLTHDYYPYHIPLTELVDFVPLLSLCLYLMMIGMLLNFKREPIISIALLIYLVPLAIVSNLFFPVGTFMNERFIYFSSVGFIVCAIYIIWYKIPVWSHVSPFIGKGTIIFILAVLILFTSRTITRNSVWESNFTLFTRDVLISENSIKCNVAAGGEWMAFADQQKDNQIRAEAYQKAIGYLEKSLSIYPKATNGHILLGNALAKYNKDYTGALEHYLAVLKYEPFDPNATKNVFIVMNSLDNKGYLNFKISICRQLISLNPENVEAMSLAGKLYGQYKQNFDSALFFLDKSYQIQPQNPELCKDLGIVHGMLGNYEQAMKFLMAARNLAPNDPSVINNIRITESMMKNAESRKSN